MKTRVCRDDEAPRTRPAGGLRVVACATACAAALAGTMTAPALASTRAVARDAVIVTKEGGGNADLDMGLKMDDAERLGIAAIGLYAEMAGTDGTGPPIVSPPRVATAMISTGNYDERVQLPAVDRAWGGERIELVDAAATAAIELPTAALYCSLNPLGFGRLHAVEVA